MAAEILMFGGFLDGGRTLDPASNDYVGGMPVEITSAGVKSTSTPASYAGIMKNDKYTDNLGDVSVDDSPMTGRACTVIFGTNYVKMVAGKLATGSTQAPFAYPGTGGTWAEGQQIYVSASGVWDNLAASGADPAFGRVVKAPTSATDDLQIYFYK
jgi:hypothetical protein